MISAHSSSVKSCVGRGLSVGHVYSEGSYQVFKRRKVSGDNPQMEQAGGSNCKSWRWIFIFVIFWGLINKWYSETKWPITTNLSERQFHISPKCTLLWKKLTRKFIPNQYITSENMLIWSSLFVNLWNIITEELCAVNITENVYKNWDPVYANVPMHYRINANNTLINLAYF